MGFLSPWFLFGTAAAAIPIVLHLLKHHPEIRVKFSAVRLLQRAPVAETRRQRLNRLLLLALRVAALIMLSLAFARPFLPSDAAAGSSGVTIVALDTSMSLTAPGRFEKAQQLARDAIQQAPAGDLIGVVTFSDRAQPVVSPTGDRALARAAVDRASAGFGATRYREALSAGADMLEGRRGTIIVVTDLQESGWDEGDRTSLPDSTRIEVADVGAPGPNLAIIDLRWSGDHPVAAVRNAGDQDRDARLSLTVDGRPAGTVTAMIGAKSTTDITLPPVRGQEASAAVDDPDGVAGDNVRYAVIGQSSRPRVLVVTASGDLAREAFYVQNALAAAGADGPAFDVEGVSGAQLSTWDEARYDQYGAVLLLSTRGLDRRARELMTGRLRRGGGLLVAAGPTLDARETAEVIGPDVTLAASSTQGSPQTLAPADTRHPVFQTFGAGIAALGLVKFQRSAAIRGADCHALARFTGGEAALLECGVGGAQAGTSAPGTGRVLVFASDLGNQWNDFPRHATFVPFLQEAVRYLLGDRRMPGEYLIAEVPDGVPPAPGIASLPDLEAGQGSRRVAINVDPAESQGGRLSEAEFQAAVTRLQEIPGNAEQFGLDQQEDRQQIWRYLLGVMFAILALESLVAARTV